MATGDCGACAGPVRLHYLRLACCVQIFIRLEGRSLVLFLKYQGSGKSGRVVLRLQQIRRPSLTRRSSPAFAIEELRAPMLVDAEECENRRSRKSAAGGNFSADLIEAEPRPP